MGVASMLLGSPQAPMPSPGHMVHGSPLPMAAPFMAPQMLSPGGHPANYSMAHSMQQAAAAAAMFQQYSDAAAAGYGADMALPVPLHMHATPPRRMSACGYAGPRHDSGGYRGTPGARAMSRFAPTETVAAF